MLKITGLKTDVISKYTLCSLVAKKLNVSEYEITNIKILKKSIDARRRTGVKYEYSLAFEAKNEDRILKENKNKVSVYTDKKYEFSVKTPLKSADVVIIGSGPAGLFCALTLVRCGINVVILERGEDVDSRSETVKNFQNGQCLNTNSNIQFGEGGAGTFSDGKLTCGVNDIRHGFILEEFVKNGAPREITYDSKPHVGTDYLKSVIKSMHKEIESLGGKFVFGALFNDFEINESELCAVIYEDIKSSKPIRLKCDFLVLATGHSARDTYSVLYHKGLKMQKKPFSIGVRIEHKREYINFLRYHDHDIAQSLPAADYKLSCHPGGRGAYTFCMCPGGVVVAGASENGGVVTNGMSDFARDGENSNSAVLVAVHPEDIPGDSPLDAIEFQRKAERLAFENGGSDFCAPCQKLGDFMNDKISDCFGDVEPSYLPGVKFADVASCLPDFVTNTLKKAFEEFDNKMEGFLLSDAIITGVETRSSSPVRILRDETMQSNIRGIYPIGEGAGYAGGIMSSASDGIKCAEQIAKILSE